MILNAQKAEKTDVSGTWKPTTYQSEETPKSMRLANYLKIIGAKNVDAVVKLIALSKTDVNDIKNERTYRSVYIKAKDTTILRYIPSGNYYAKIAYGTDWREREEDGRVQGKFFTNTFYKMGQEIMDFNGKCSGEGVDFPSYELVLNIDPAEGPVESYNYIKPEDRE